MTNEEAKVFLLQLHTDKQLNKSEHEALRVAIKALEQTRWIPVSERLPKKEDEYLCTIQTRAIYTDKVIDTYINFCNFMDGGWGVFGDETVIAWMALPEPYNAESDK